jgi:hypothetical protein
MNNDGGNAITTAALVPRSCAMAGSIYRLPSEADDDLTIYTFALDAATIMVRRSALCAFRFSGGTRLWSTTADLLISPSIRVICGLKGTCFCWGLATAPRAPNGSSRIGESGWMWVDWWQPPAEHVYYSTAAGERGVPRDVPLRERRP